MLKQFTVTLRAAKEKSGMLCQICVPSSIIYQSDLVNHLT